MNEHDRLFELISELVTRHSPSGAEAEIDGFLINEFNQRGHSATLDACGNLFVKIAGSNRGRIAITAHKDEIGAFVTQIGDDGTLKIDKFAGAYPWVYGEGVVDVLGDMGVLHGILSFGSRHVSHASPQHAHQDKAPVRWRDAWVETKLSTTEIAAAGVRIGSRVVVGKHRKAPFRLGHHIAGYALDNKASIAILLDLAERVVAPNAEIFLIASTKEEVGAIGALYFTKNQPLDALIALEVAPVAPEYSIKITADPVLARFSHRPVDFPVRGCGAD